MTMEISVSTSTIGSPTLRMPQQSAGVDRGASSAAAIAGVGGVEAASILGDLFGAPGDVLDVIAPHIPYVGPVYDFLGGVGSMFGL
jgi:hypothetical protein